MTIQSLIVLILSIALTACTARPEIQRPNGTDVALSEASYSVSRSLVTLSETAQASRPPSYAETPPNPASYHMAQLTSVDWSGPVEPLVKQLANASNYRLRVLGTPPGIPVLVTVYAKNTMLADILRDVGYQCGRRASIVVYPDSQVIELRYAKN